MKVLVATAAYPTCDGARPQYFVHSRNLYYIKYGIDVTVLNFATKTSYVFDGIQVISLSEYKVQRNKFDLLICHAANIRNHYRFLRKYRVDFNKIIFFFHGHEVLHLNKYYPKPYAYVKRKRVPRFIQELYDSFKISVWKRYYLSQINNIRLVFVSTWIYKQFLIELKIDGNQLLDHAKIIKNSVGVFFENNRYEPNRKLYDFITIRGNLDGSKYAVDIVITLANKHPEYSFCLIGKGEFFKYYKKPDNVVWINREMSHEEMAEYINSSKYALLPTREDTQGLMACELAAYGIPLITSDIEVCHEVFADCPRCVFVSNMNPNLNQAIDEISKMEWNVAWDEYYAKNTIVKEIEYLKEYNKV